MLALSSTAARGVAAACAPMQRPTVQRFPGFPALACSRGCGWGWSAPQGSVTGTRTTVAAASSGSGTSSEAAGQDSSPTAKPALWLASVAPGRPAAEQLLLAAPCLPAPLAACTGAAALALLTAMVLQVPRVWASMEVEDRRLAEREARDRCRHEPVSWVLLFAAVCCRLLLFACAWHAFGGRDSSSLQHAVLLAAKPTCLAAPLTHHPSRFPAFPACCSRQLLWRSCASACPG